MKINLEKKILSENDRIALENRKLFKADGAYVLNLMSSPGSGKTSLLEKTIPSLGNVAVGVIEGDVETEKDARRIAKVTSNVVAIETHGACHLSAARVAKAYEALRDNRPGVVFIENIGNLVCPANYDLGEDCRVIVLSVAEGDDKPEKYPGIFVNVDAVVINKVDLLPYLDCDIRHVKDTILRMNSTADIMELSCRTGEGLDAWLHWLKGKAAAKGGPAK